MRPRRAYPCCVVLHGRTAGGYRGRVGSGWGPHGHRQRAASTKTRRRPQKAAMMGAPCSTASPSGWQGSRSPLTAHSGRVGSLGGFGTLLQGRTTRGHSGGDDSVEDRRSWSSVIRENEAGSSDVEGAPQGETCVEPSGHVGARFRSSSGGVRVRVRSAPKARSERD